MPTSNIPLTYACRLNGSVHLYIVIYAAQRPGYPTQGTRTDETMNFFINNVQTVGTNPQFEYYTFNINGFDTQNNPYKITEIEVHYSTHIRKIMVDDLDEVDTLPSTTSDQAFDVPYAYTQLGSDDHHFGAEIVLYAETAKKFKCVHCGPLEEDAYGNTESKITIDANATAVTVFTASNEFEVNDVLTTDGSHTVTYTEGTPPNEKKRKSKTKNKNISQTPFPGGK